MKFKPQGTRLFLQMGLLFAVLLGAAFLVAGGRYLYTLLLLPVVAFQWTRFYRYLRKAQEEVDQFVEAVQYRDFSRHFDVQQAPAELQPLRRGFNDINSTFRVITREKETQYHYLQQILELVETGILSFEVGSGKVVWMNESLKRMLHLPYLKTVHSLSRRDPELYSAVMSAGARQTKIAAVQTPKGSVKVLLSASGFQSEGQHFRLIAFQNIHEALDETEARAWQKLLSVMTHEIMNSIAPISSLADTMKHRLEGYRVHQEGEEGELEDLQLGIETIRRRSEGLLRFAETYRSLNRITRLNVQRISVSELLGNLHGLMLPTMEQKGISLEVLLRDPQLSLAGDPHLLEQVLINLLVNAMEAVRGKDGARIVMSADKGGTASVVLKVEDNGTGIPEELLETIFIPFFSTRKNGSGIGLSLCRQIVLLHKGQLRVQSREGVGTAFSLELPQEAE